MKRNQKMSNIDWNQQLIVPVRESTESQFKHLIVKTALTFAIKMDIEGYEYEIFKEKDIPLKINKMMIEFHTKLMGREKSIKLIKKLYSQGFYVDKMIEDLPLRLYPFMKILWKRFSWEKKGLREEDIIEEIFKGRELKYLYLKRKG